VESYLLALLPSFDPAQVNSTLFIPENGVLAERMRARGITVELGAPTRKLAFNTVAALARRWSGQFEIVHAHGPRALFWAVHAARLARVPALVASVHELRWQTHRSGLKRSAWLALERWSLCRTQRLIAVSEATRRDLVEQWKCLGDRTSTVHGSAPVLLNSEALPSARAARPGEPLRLVTVGRFSWQKGYDLLFPALAILRDRGVAWSLAVIGSGTLETELRAQVARLGLGDRIHWLGRDADVAGVLTRSHVFVAATRAEMFGIAVLEAMAFGLPVLAPAVGSLLEVMSDGETGVLVPFEPEDSLPSRMADVLARWAANPAEAAQYGEAGAARARREFSPRVLADRVTAVYLEVLNRSAAGATNSSTDPDRTRADTPLTM
jgi:glycosyltransferase involved in cell wall biosynthesis